MIGLRKRKWVTGPGLLMLLDVTCQIPVMNHSHMRPENEEKENAPAGLVLKPVLKAVFFFIPFPRTKAQFCQKAFRTH
jgi:hypothetical protein